MTEGLTIVAIVIACAALVVVAVLLWRARHAGQPHAMLMAELARQQTDSAARLDAHDAAPHQQPVAAATQRQ